MLDKGVNSKDKHTETSKDRTEVMKNEISNSISLLKHTFVSLTQIQCKAPAEKL